MENTDFYCLKRKDWKKMTECWVRDAKEKAKLFFSAQNLFIVLEEREEKAVYTSSSYDGPFTHNA